MDNVLIDDRRIKVDFSQSVAKERKIRWRGKGKGIEDLKPEVQIYGTIFLILFLTLIYHH